LIAQPPHVAVNGESFGSWRKPCYILVRSSNHLREEKLACFQRTVKSSRIRVLESERRRGW
jgi:hypothetical protein